ncbi:hypothetical protein [Caballeronia sp. HLA56]
MSIADQPEVRYDGHSERTTSEFYPTIASTRNGLTVPLEVWKETGLSTKDDWRLPALISRDLGGNATGLMQRGVCMRPTFIGTIGCLSLLRTAFFSRRIAAFIEQKSPQGSQAMHFTR